MNGYFDYGAATPLDPKALEAMLPYLRDQFYNPSATYRPARNTKVVLDTARIKVAGILGAKPLEIIFTAGATEANNLAIHGVMRQYPDANIIISAIEHESVSAPAKKYDHATLPVNNQGVLGTSDIAKHVDDKTAIVSVMLANNEIGTIQPVAQLARELALIKKQRATAGNKLPLLLHCDAAQAGNYLDLHVSRLGVDLMSINGGKVYGPKQSGALYVKSGVLLEPIIDGGGQERGLRSGTENVAGAVGFAEALEIAQNMRHLERERLSKLQDYLLSQLSLKITDAVVNGSLKTRLPNNVHITLPGQDSERLIMLLDDRGIYVASGSACSASNEKPSHVLAEIGLSENDIRASLRISMGRATTQTDLDGLITALLSVLA